VLVSADSFSASLLRSGGLKTGERAAGERSSLFAVIPNPPYFGGVRNLLFAFRPPRFNPGCVPASTPAADSAPPKPLIQASRTRRQSYIIEFLSESTAHLQARPIYDGHPERSRGTCFSFQGVGPSRPDAAKPW